MGVTDPQSAIQRVLYYVNTNRRLRATAIFVLGFSWLYSTVLLIGHMMSPEGGSLSSSVSQSVMNVVSPESWCNSRWSFKLDDAEGEEKYYATHHDLPQAYFANNARCPGNIAHKLHALEQKWGQAGLDMSLAHGGSGIRIRRFLRKLIRGDKVKIGVMGGSIAYGHHIILEKGEKTFAQLLEEDLKAVFPHANIEMTNGAVPATGTDYFASCYHHHVDRDSDLFILEAAVNDRILDQNVKDKVDALQYTEMLVRSLLKRHSDTAVIILSTFSHMWGYENAAQRHAIVSEYYDIPRLSSRAFLWSYLLQHRDTLLDEWYPPYGSGYGQDPYHPSEKGHMHMSDIMLHYLLKEACRLGNDHSLDSESQNAEGSMGSELSKPWDPLQVPLTGIKQGLMDKPRPEPEPFCLSINAKDKEGNPMLKPSESKGFERADWNGKSYWRSTTVGSTITFKDIEVSSGVMGLYFQHAMPVQGMGMMKCWADNMKDRAVVLDGSWGWGVSVGARGAVATGLSKGKHSLTCEVLEETKGDKEKDGGHRCDIIAVMAS